eukprot:Rmarinus@m.20470
MTVRRVRVASESPPACLLCFLRSSSRSSNASTSTTRLGATSPNAARRLLWPSSGSFPPRTSPTPFASRVRTSRALTRVPPPVTPSSTQATMTRLPMTTRCPRLSSAGSRSSCG